MLKKTIMLISFVLMLCVMFVSCSEIDRFPSYSKNFDKDFCESFFDDYYLADAGLAYYKASPEVRIDVNQDGLNKTMIIGKIKNTNKSQFVSVVDNAKFVFMAGGGDEGDLYIYQHKNAPNPMADWQIESVSLVVTYSNPNSINAAGDVYSFSELSEKYMDIVLSSSREIKTFKSNNENDVEFIEVIQNAYLNATRDTSQKTVYIYPDGGPPEYYYLLVKFKENSNIVWYTPLIISHDGFRICHTFDNYDEYISYEGPNGHSNANETASFSYEGLETHYGTLSEEMTNELYKILIDDGWDPQENTPIPPTTTALPEAPASSNADPDSEVIPSDPNLPAVTTPPGR